MPLLARELLAHIRLTRWRIAILPLLFCLSAPASAQAREGSRIEIQLPSAAGPVVVRVREAMTGGRFEELLRNGFDVRLHFRAELWKTGRIFNDVVAQTEWDMIVHYDQFDQSFEAARIDPSGIVVPLGSYRRLVDAQSALSLPYSPPIKAPEFGVRYYYSVQADIETLDLRDLDEVTRWLRGELGPAVQGRKNPGTAIGRGLKTLVSRVLGGEVRRLEARSPRFIVTEGPPPVTPRESP